MPDQLVLAPGEISKGSLRRFQAHVAAVVGEWGEADRGFRAAVAAHRALGVPALLARTLQEWGRSLSGRDDLLARRCFQESEELLEALAAGARTAPGGGPAVPTYA